MKNVDRKVAKHAMSKIHLSTREQLLLYRENRIKRVLPEGRRLADIKYNKNVGINRRILSYVVCFFLGNHKNLFVEAITKVVQ